MISVKYAQENPKVGYRCNDGGEVYKNADLTAPKVDVGISGEYHSGKSVLFAELVLGMPANQVNGQYFDNPTVGHYSL